MRLPSVSFIIFLTKVGPKLLTIMGKVLSAKFGLAAASALSYTLLFTWQFAIMIMLMLFVHESGHVWAMKRSGVPTKGFYFIPFWGGAAVADSDFPSRKAEMYIAIMGPIWGFALALVAGIIYHLTEEPTFAAAAGWMALINLFQLIPINPLDGGRMVKSIAFSLNSDLGLAVMVLGMGGALMLAIVQGISIFYILIPIGAIELIAEFRRERRKREGSQRQEMPKMTGNQIIYSGLSYAVLGLVLYSFMSLMQHLPGADLAMEILRG